MELRAQPTASLAAEERAVLEVLEALDRGDRPLALTRAEALRQAVPTFELLEALVAALEGAHSAEALALLRREWLADGASGESPPVPLREELAQRWAHRQFIPPATLPFVLHVDETVRHLIVVETSTSRLYVLRNTPQGLELQRDYYASIGRRGDGKQAEGDERTPLGVYFTLSRMDDEGLAERYGAHAFPLDYPNEWDRRQERTGRGIWIHGVPAETYSRPPLDSDGCVALTNLDIGWLARHLAPLHTPVVIMRELPRETASLSPAATDALRERLGARLAVHDGHDFFEAQAETATALIAPDEPRNI
ncbi:MAG: L,D-transpeptidase, partial [Pseudomonadota bacterium]